MPHGYVHQRRLHHILKTTHSSSLEYSIKMELHKIGRGGASAVVFVFQALSVIRSEPHSLQVSEKIVLRESFFELGNTKYWSGVKLYSEKLHNVSIIYE
jgi:hypothetical protein